jgi:GxxExxY protein
MIKENQIAAEIVDAAIEVHKVLGGPGLLESVYEESLGFELRLRHLFVERQKIVPVVYKGNPVTAPFRLDMIVSQTVIVECKATNEYNKIYESQLLTYLRLTGLKLGLVINFGEALVAKGIHRVIN